MAGYVAIINEPKKKLWSVGYASKDKVWSKASHATGLKSKILGQLVDSAVAIAEATGEVLVYVPSAYAARPGYCIRVLPLPKEKPCTYFMARRDARAAADTLMPKPRIVKKGVTEAKKCFHCKKSIKFNVTWKNRKPRYNTINADGSPHRCIKAVDPEDSKTRYKKVPPIWDTL